VGDLSDVIGASVCYVDVAGGVDSDAFRLEKAGLQGGAIGQCLYAVACEGGDDIVAWDGIRCERYGISKAGVGSAADSAAVSDIADGGWWEGGLVLFPNSGMSSDWGNK
jgi:hypothetical protein